MAWNKIEWGCGHTGRMQLYGPWRQREARVAYEAGRDCMVCWLIQQWEKAGDPRATREDREDLAAKIAAGKGKEIDV